MLLIVRIWSIVGRSLRDEQVRRAGLAECGGAVIPTRVVVVSQIVPAVSIVVVVMVLVGGAGEGVEALWVG